MKSPLLMLRPYRRELLSCLLLTGVTLVALVHVLDNGFVNFDDETYVTQNLDVQAGVNLEGVIWACTEVKRASNWHPLTWISLMLDYELFGMNPWGFHLTNLLLHLANVLLLFLCLRWMTGAVWQSGAVAAFFAVHPLHVESVAWVSERKDVLSTFFGMVTILAYLFFLQRPQRARYLLLLLAFGLGLLAKPMLVTLPCVLLLLDFWPLRRFSFSPGANPGNGTAGPSWGKATLRRLVLEKLPLFILVAAACAVTLYAQTRAVKSLQQQPLLHRLGNAAVAYVVYLGKTIWPDDLAAYYPLAPEGPPFGEVVAAGMILLVLTVALLGSWRRRPYLAVGWLWYLGTLVPVIGLIQVGSQALADRYTYVPLIGIFLLLGWGVPDLLPRRWQWTVLVPTMLVLLLACMVVTWYQVQVWHDSRTLWERTLDVTPDNFLAHTNLAFHLYREGNREEALGHFERAAATRPDLAEGQARWGWALLRMGRPTAALPKYQRAVAMEPEKSQHHFALAGVLRELGQAAAAETQEQEGERLLERRK